MISSMKKLMKFIAIVIVTLIAIITPIQVFASSDTIKESLASSENAIEIKNYPIPLEEGLSRKVCN